MDTPDMKSPLGGVAPQSRRVMNLAHVISQNARRFPDLPGLIWRGRHWSWREIEGEVCAFASALAARGIARGDRVMVHSKNTPEMFFSMYACFRLGAVWVPTNFRLMPEEITYLAEFSGAKAFLCHADFPEHAAIIARAVKSVGFIWSMGEATFGETSVEKALHPYRGKGFVEAGVEHDDPCWFFFTSGTTGRSKAAVLTHGQMGFVMTNHLADLLPGITERDAALVVAPLSHGAGIHQMNVVARGAPTILMPGDSFDIEEAYRLIAEHHVSNMFTVPTILKLLAEHEAAGRYDHSSLKFVIYAGAPMYRADQQHALRVLGKCIVQYFGLGEVTGNITVLPAHLHSLEDGADARVGSCGIARTGMQISIQNEQGAELGAGETGEICVCGPAVFAGYYNNEEANEKAFRNGWFRTGDLGHLDPKGFLFITGRASDMYISGGSNIYPREIEEKILTHPGILEAAVLGVPDPLWGEVGIAVCVKRAGSNVTEEGLIDFLTGKINRYKMPKRVVFWAELPKSGYGKIPKRLIRDELEKRGEISPA